jgi:hypothetical protein
MDMAFGSVGVDARRVEDELGREDDGGSAGTCDREVSSSGVAAVKLLADAIPYWEADGLIVSD